MTGRAVLLALGITLLPQACEKVLGGKKPPEPLVQVDPPPTAPPPSVTTPPIWRPPEPAGVDAGPSKPEGPSDATRARAAIEAKEFKKARGILEKKVKGGKGTSEEAQMLVEACTALRDKACIEAGRKATVKPEE